VGGGSRYKILGTGGPEGGPGLECVAYVFVFLGGIICRLYRLTFLDQSQVTLHLRVSLSDLVLRFSAGSPLHGGTKIFFHGRPNPLSAAVIAGSD
jgi:hypothetical protein